VAIINEYLKHNLLFLKAAYSIENKQYKEKKVSQQYFSSISDNEFLDDEDKSYTQCLSDKSSKTVTSTISSSSDE